MIWCCAKMTENSELHSDVFIVLKRIDSTSFFVCVVYFLHFFKAVLTVIFRLTLCGMFSDGVWLSVYLQAGRYVQGHDGIWRHQR